MLVDYVRLRLPGILAGVLSLLAVATSIAESPDAGRLRIPSNAPNQTANPGLQKIGHSFLYVPSDYHGKQVPLLILLHKAGGNASEWFRTDSKGPHGLYAAHADAGHFAILAPEAPGETWGSGGPKSFGYDAVAINRAIAATFAQCAIDRTRLAIGGFSDGGSYALSLGLANGDLFSNVIAFSPGYIVGAPGRGRPLLFIAHGGGDQLLPIAVTSRIFVARLRKNGYHVDFREFAGGHAVMPAVADEAMNWLTASFRRTR